MSDATPPILETRQAIEELVCDLPGGRPDELAFGEQWEIRAFALAVSAHTAGEYDWQQFQGALIDSISEWEAAHPAPADGSWSYYEHWVTALEKVLANVGVLDQGVLAERTAHVLSVPPNRNHHEAVLEPVAVDPAITAARS